MENNFDSIFKSLAKKIKLSSAEKSFYRETILEFINKNGVSPVISKNKVRSSYHCGLFFKTHYLIVSLTLFLILSVTFVSAAEMTIPGDSLYPIKINIIEPVQIFLVSTAESKNHLRVNFIGRALQDYSKAVLSQNLDQNDKNEFVDSVSLKIENIHEEILQLAHNNDIYNALEVANDLRSVLFTQTFVLDELNKFVAENDTAINDDSVSISESVDEHLSVTAEIVNDLTQAILDSDSFEKLDQTVSDQKEKISDSFADIENASKSVLQKGTFDLEYQNSVSSKLSDIAGIIEQGDKKLSETDQRGAFILYNQADQKLGELKSLMDSGQALDVDIIDESANSNF